MYIPGVDRGSGVVIGATHGVAIECCIGIPDVDGGVGIVQGVCTVSERCREIPSVDSMSGVVIFL